jgi:AraC-like DNA-binding protein
MLPRIRLADNRELCETGNNRSYTCRHHCLHVFDYAVRLTAGDEVYELNPGDAALTAALLKVRYDSPAPSSHFVFHFDFDTNYDSDLIPPFTVFRLGSSYPQVLSECMQVRTESKDKALWLQRSAGAGLYRLICRLHAESRSTPSASGKADVALDRSVAWIEENMHLAIRVEDVVQVAGLDGNYLARRFKNRYGCTIQRYIQERRLVRAHYWLESTDLPIKMIAGDLGFYDPQHFYRCFKRHYKTTPGDVRRRAGGLEKG